MELTDRFITALPAACYSRVAPTPVGKPEILVQVPEVVALIGGELPAVVLGGNRTLPGTTPYAACYGGHQFGTWAGQLGDGRAITLGEAGEWEIQLKGAGPTPYSRRGDGRAVLRSALRELVCSEAMFHLGVPTTRALALVRTGEVVQRDLLYDGNPRFEPGAITVRVAKTFLRFGNFELFASREDRATLEALVRYTMERYFPHRSSVAMMFGDVCIFTMYMLTQWMRVGFVHGVMNTDNMSILGDTIDYGPFGFVEPYDLEWTPNITDAQGRRYRFGAQPQVAYWNLAQLARALAPVADDAGAIQSALASFPAQMHGAYRNTMLRKLGLRDYADTTAQDDQLLVGLHAILENLQPDHTLFFWLLADAWEVGQLAPAFYRDITKIERDIVAGWLRDYRVRAGREVEDVRAAMRLNNPLYIPRNYLLHEVIEAAERGDTAPLVELIDVLRQPCVEQPGRENYAAKRPDWAIDKPGCSMLSCSS